MVFVVYFRDRFIGQLQLLGVWFFILWDYVHDINNTFDCAEESAILKQLHSPKTQDPMDSGLIEGEENVRPVLQS